MRRKYFPYIALIFSTILFGASCKHLSSTASASDEFTDAPVRGDTIAYSSKMDMALREDSVRHNDAFFYRINHVKRAEITDEDGKKVLEFDRFGHELTNRNYLRGELFWEFIDVYNEYGQVARSVNSFYINGLQDESTYETKNEFQIVGSQAFKVKSVTTHYKGGDQGSKYRYYVYAEGLLSIMKVYEGDQFVQESFYKYDSLGLLRQEYTFNYSISKPDSARTEYRYDNAGRKMSCSILANGQLVEDNYYEWNEMNRQSKYRNIDYKYDDEYVVEYSYLPNGLISEEKVTYKGKTEIHHYRYAYYAM